MQTYPRRHLALLAVLALGLGACGDDGPGDPTVAPETDVDASADPLGETEVEMYGEGDLEEGEVVPGVRLEVPEGADVQAQPLPTGAGYVAAFQDGSGAVFLDVQHDAVTLDELLADIDTLVAEGAAEMSAPPRELDVEGADEAATFELTDPTGEAIATGVFATVGTTAVSLAIEIPADSDLDVAAIVDSLAIDPDRLSAEA